MRILAFIGFLAILVAVAAGGYFFGGFFNVGAGWDDPAPVRLALVQTRMASIRHHAREVGAPPVKLDDPAVIRDGAKEYAEHGCTNCHGGPGVSWAKFSEGLNPDPPDLKEDAAGMDAKQLFWVIKNGIRMTGMPSFGKAGASDGDIWKIAAFIKALPKVSEADFKSWTAPPAPAPAAAPPAAAPAPAPTPAPATPEGQPR